MTSIRAPISPWFRLRCNGDTVCIYVAYQILDTVGLANGIRWIAVDTAGTNVGNTQLEVSGNQVIVFSNPVLDVDPASDRSAVVYSRRNAGGDITVGTPSDSNRFVWVDPEPTGGAYFSTNIYPIFAAAAGLGSTDPSVAATAQGSAAVVWTNRFSNVRMFEIADTGVPLIRGKAGELDLKVGLVGVGQTVGWPQVVSAKGTDGGTDGTYDRYDGNLRFVWLYETGGNAYRVAFSATRPSASHDISISAGSALSSKPDVARDGDGGTHIVFQEDVPAVGLRVRYQYYKSICPPLANQPAGACGFDTVVYGPPNNPISGWSPRLEITTAPNPADPGLVITKVHVIFMQGPPAGFGQSIYMATYQPGNPVPINGPALFAGDNNVLAQVWIHDIDTAVFVPIDRTNQNPDGPGVLVAAWAEEGAGPKTRIVYGAATDQNGPFRLETVVKESPVLDYDRVSLALGPGNFGDRLYFTYEEDSSKIYLQRLTPTGTCWEHLLSSPSMMAHDSAIAVDREFDVERHAADMSSTLDISDSSIHAVYSGKLAGHDYNVFYQRLFDRSDIACTNGDGVVVVVSERPVTQPAPAWYFDHESVILPTVSLQLTKENRLVVVYEAVKLVGWRYGSYAGRSEIYMVGLTNAGDQEFFTEASLSFGRFDGFAPTQRSTPRLAIQEVLEGSFERISTIAVVSDRLANGQHSVGYLEVVAVPVT